MQFLSSKLVHDLQMAFSDILDKERVKEGQVNLQKLKKERQFELALATFISRSSDYHKRLLAILQLQKKLFIEDKQTVWSLKQVYFRDSDKIAEKIRKIITLKQNIKMASEFLVVDVYQAGSSVYRQIQMVFSMLKHEDKAQLASQYHFKKLCQYFIDAITIVQNHQPCFFMLIVSLALFYQAALRYNQSHFQQISIHWKNIQPKCSTSQIEGVFIIYFSIKITIFGQQIEYKQNSLGIFLRSMFCKRSQISIDYFSKCWSIVGRYGQILSIQRIRQQFIESMTDHNRNLNKQMLSNIKIYGTHHIQLEKQMFVQDNNELLVRQICNRFINSIFSQHYQWLNQSYLIKQDPRQVLQILLAIINYYNSIQLPNLQQLTTTLVQKVCNQLQNCFSIEDLNAQQRNTCITYIDFLTKYKAQIQLCQLSNIVGLLAKISQTCPILSPFCDTFLSQVWKELACLQINQLIEFLQFHLLKINENEWAICFERYECFLRLAVYLQQSSSYFSTCTQSDTLLASVLKSHQIICEFLKNNGDKINFEIFHIFLQLTKSIIQNKRFKRDPNLYNKLNIPFLIDKIQRHLFLNEDTAVIVAYYRYHTKIIVKCLKEQKQKWEIDQLDYTYRISLYLAQIQLASQLISQIQLQQMRKQLELQIGQFLKEMSSSQFQKMKLGKLWDRLQNVYNISKYVQQKMDIESI